MSLENVQEGELEAFKYNTDKSSLGANYKIKCQKCLVSSLWSNWKADWISLDEKNFGQNAKHIRIRCPNCNELIDHKTTKDNPIEIIE